MGDVSSPSTGDEHEQAREEEAGWERETKDLQAHHGGPRFRYSLQYNWPSPKSWAESTTKGPPVPPLCTRGPSALPGNRLHGVRGRSPPRGGNPSCLASSRGVTSLRPAGPCGRRSPGRVVLVDHPLCAATRRALEHGPLPDVVPAARPGAPRRAVRRPHLSPLGCRPAGDGGCVADLRATVHPGSRPDPTVRACKPRTDRAHARASTLTLSPERVKDPQHIPRSGCPQDHGANRAAIRPACDLSGHLLVRHQLTSPRGRSRPSGRRTPRRSHRGRSVHPPR